MKSLDISRGASLAVTNSHNSLKKNVTNYNNRKSDALKLCNLFPPLFWWCNLYMSSHDQIFRGINPNQTHGRSAPASFCVSVHMERVTTTFIIPSFPQRPWVISNRRGGKKWDSTSKPYKNLANTSKNTLRWLPKNKTKPRNEDE